MTLVVHPSIKNDSGTIKRNFGEIIINLKIINKINKGDALFVDNRMDRIRTYFAYNQITKEKIDLIENKSGLNLSEIRGFINNKV